MKWSRLGVLLATVVAVAGCGDTIGPTGEHQLQVTVRLVNGGGSPAAGLSASRQATGATTVDIESVVFVLGGLKLETAGLDETVDWVLEESVVLPLDLSGTPVLAFDTDVPAGVYKELEVSVDKLEVGHPAEEPLIADWPDLADASVVVTGVLTREGGASEPFTFPAALDIDLELPFEEPVTFTAGENPVTLVSLTIDLSG